MRGARLPPSHDGALDAEESPWQPTGPSTIVLRRRLGSARALDNTGLAPGAETACPDMYRCCEPSRWQQAFSK